MENDLKNGRQPKKKEDNLKKNGTRPQKKNGRQPQEQFKKSTLIGCAIIVNL